MLSIVKIVKNTLIVGATILFLQGCDQNTVVIPKEKASTNILHLTADDAIISIANQLSINNKLEHTDNGSMTIVSFVDLEQFKKTSRFGMILAESLYNELFIRGFNVSEIRGQNSININATGEFYISRDITKLQSEVSNSYIVLGTYSKIDEKMMINARIIDNKTGKVVSSARAMYVNDDCTIYGTCNNASRKINLVGSDCKLETCDDDKSSNKINKEIADHNFGKPQKIVF